MSEVHGEQIRATVVIPYYNNTATVDRALKSVLRCNGSCIVEVVVVDDGSACPPEQLSLRKQDKLITFKENKGGAAARNAGIDAAKGELIYLLDADDYFMDRDFIYDCSSCMSRKTVWYSNIASGKFQSQYPAYLTREQYFYYIFYKYPFITQTSSLCFRKSAGLKFDESLPKHQDWDFIYSALVAGVEIRVLAGRTYFDRSDRNSLSRTIAPKKSELWYAKLCDLGCVSVEDIKYAHYNLFVLSKKDYPAPRFLGESFRYLYKRKLSVLRFLKNIILRIKVY